MSRLYHSAVYPQLLALRQELAEAFEKKDAMQVPALAGQIDQIQLACWTDGVFQNAS